MKQTIELSNEETQQAVTDFLTKKFKSKGKDEDKDPGKGAGWKVTVGTKMVPQGHGPNETDVPVAHITASREI